MVKIKIIIIFLSAILCSQYINAQWYSRSCGVTDINTCTDEEFECMWEKASSTSRSGAITCLTGTSIIAIGGITMAIGAASEDSEKAVWNGLSLCALGTLIDLVGVPIWLTGAGRKFKLKESPGYQGNTTPSMNISPALVNDPGKNLYYPGISISIRF